VYTPAISAAETNSLNFMGLVQPTDFVMFQ